MYPNAFTLTKAVIDLVKNLQWQDFAVVYENNEGNITRGEVDLAVVDLTITAERQSAVDFTLPFMNTGIALALHVMGRLSPYEWFNPYPSNLAAFLTVVNYEYPFNEAVELLQHPEIKFGCSTCHFFRDSNNSNYKAMWELMQFVDSNDAGRDRVEKDAGAFAYFMESKAVEYDTERYCSVTQRGGLLDNKGYGIAVNQNNKTLKRQLDEGILQLQEGGVLHVLYDRWWKQKGGGTCLDSGTGSINFYQESPLDPTEFNINLNLTSPAAYFYGIDAIPSIKRKKPETKKCPNIKETIFNPNSLDSENIPFEGQGTTDQYAIGDLSGKFCSISYPAPSPNYKPGYNQPIKILSLYGNDYNLPLFGKNSVIGRALVFYDLEGNAVSCANIDLLGGNMNTAYATFDQPIQGQFIFRQSANYCNDEVFVYVEISKPDSLNAYRTDNHGWHIHDYPVKTGKNLFS
ncbi:hypothetical protein RND71_043866 [Anisodus tanguticus]|uniref:Ionotropic glutamate receptor C-terminal domain-containing protein n=1 Tax=Anisodus tanguticus TaxID=243964 RepID=A0AAE1QPU8_9SOLA|nr:hypothetical protein RND71_043866 [Anisodus tanguticus]